MPHPEWPLYGGPNQEPENEDPLYTEGGAALSDEETLRTGDSDRLRQVRNRRESTTEGAEPADTPVVEAEPSTPEEPHTSETTPSEEPAAAAGNTPPPTPPHADSHHSHGGGGHGGHGHGGHHGGEVKEPLWKQGWWLLGTLGAITWNMFKNFLGEMKKSLKWKGGGGHGKKDHGHDDHGHKKGHDDHGHGKKDDHGHH